jgi:hypothetical protein
MSGGWAEAKCAIARLAAPIAFWMAAGWTAYPYAMEYIVSQSGEAANLQEIRDFSIAASVGCVLVGALAVVYCYTARVEATMPPQREGHSCPYCLAEVPGDAGSCPACGRPTSAEPDCQAAGGGHRD